MSSFHSKQTIYDGIHAPISYIFPNEASRLASTNYIQSDGYKFAIDLDTKYIYCLTDWQNGTWSQVSGEAGGGGGGSPTGAAGGDLQGTYPNPQVKDLTISGEVQGSILYFNGTAWVHLSPSVDGYVLTTHGNSQNPSWTQIVGDGGGIGGSAGGDLSGTYPNPTIANNAITTLKISNNNITLSKLEQITTNSLLGRDTVGTGNVENISLNSTLEMTGSGSLQRSAISGDITIAAGSNTAAISSGVIVNGDINASAGINLSKLESITSSTLVGNPTGVSANPSLITLDSTLNFNGTTIRRSAISGDVSIAAGSNTATVTDLTITGESQGSVLYFNGTNWVRLLPGTVGQLLQTNGVAANPSWITPATIITDHGGLSGLSDDDHTQYLLADGTRSVSGNLTVNGNIIVTGTVDGYDLNNTFGIINNDINVVESSVSTVSGNLSTHTSNNNNPHNTSIANIGGGTLAQLNLAISDADLDAAGTARPPNGSAGGDLSGSYPNPTIVDNAITTVKVLNNNINFAKMQTIATDSLLGRDTAGTGNVESIGLNSTLQFTGSGSIGRSAISGDVTIASGSNSATVTDLTITGEVQGSVLYFNGTNWVHLAPGTAGDVLQTQGSGANPSWATVSSGSAAPSGPAGGNLGGSYPNPTVVGLTIASQAQGDILYFNGTSWVRLAAGTSGQLLQTNGTGANPTWATVGGTNTFSDSLFRIQDNADATKQIAFEASGITTATTRTITIPDANVNLTGLVHSGDSAGGDLTGTYPNPTINADSVTFAKMQNISTDSLLGRDTAGTGDVEQITLNATLEFSGSNTIRRAALTGDVTSAAGSNATTIANDAVTTVKVLNNNITFAKIQTITTDRLLGRDTAGTGNVEEISLDSTLAWSGSNSIGRSAISGDVTIASGSNTATVTDLTITGESQGSVLYFNGTNWVRLSPGTNGQYLQTQGAAANPQWSSVTTPSVFSDSLFRIQDNTDATKQLAFEVSGITTATTRTITVPNSNITIDDVSGTRTPTDNTVSTVKLINDAVTFAKIQNITTDRLLGRDTAGAGDTEEISLNSTLEFSGSGSIGRSALTGDVTAASGSNATTIANNAVTTVKILDSNITSAKIADNNVITSKVADNNITFAKIQTIATDSLLGRDTAGTGNVENITLNSTLEMTGSAALQRAAISGDVTIAAGSNTATVTDLTITGESQGSILYFNGTNWVRLAPGTSGNVLQTNGAGANPTWETVASGGGGAGSDTTAIHDNESGEIAAVTSKASPTTSDYLLIEDAAATNAKKSITIGTLPFLGSTASAGGDLTGNYPNPSVANNTISFTKMQTISTDTLLGRDTAGTGNIESISLNSTLEFTGSSSIGRSAISGDITIAAGSNTAAIGSGVIVNGDVNASAGINLSKLESITANTLIGNSTGAGAVPATISLNSTLEFNTGSLRRAALTGDVTATAGSNATTIANDAITTVKILNSNVTFAKIQNIATDTLLGRDTAGTGAVENITLNSTLEMTGAGALQRAAISGDITIAAGSNTAAIGSGVIVNGDVNASAGINLSKLESITASTLVGNPTGAGAVPSLITLDSTLNFNGTTIRRSAISGDVTIALGSNTATVTDLTITSEAQGDILYFNGTNWVRLGAGTNGHYLQTQGTGANPQWSAVSGGGNTFSDSLFRIQDNADATKQLAFEVSGITTATTRTITVPNASITIDDVSGTRTPTDNTVSTIKLIDNNVTFAKMQTIVTDSLLGRDTAGTGNVENITLNSTLEMTGSGALQRAAISGDVTIAAGSNTATVTDLTITGESQGSILYFNGTNWVRLAPGTNGQYLQTLGAAANPQWSSVSGGVWFTTEGNLGNISGSFELPFDGYRNLFANVTGNVTFTFNSSATVGHYQLRLTFGGTFTASFPGTVYFPGGVAYTPTASGRDIINFFKDGSGDWHATVIADWSTP